LLDARFVFLGCLPEIGIERGENAVGMGSFREFAFDREAALDTR
jgi:hypothetical protein